MKRAGEAPESSPGGVGSFGKVSGRGTREEDGLDRQRRSMIEGTYHPVVRTHPVTGRKALYVDETYSQKFADMTREESEPLLRFLIGHVTQPSFTCRLRWRKDTFVLWDNRSCIHHAFNDYDGYRRELYRTTVMGEAPA